MRLSELLRAKGREVQDERPAEREVGHNEPNRNEQVVLLDVASIQPNPYQPRREFAEAALAGLARSIEKQGLLQPVIVRRTGNGYQLLMGERRLRACESLGWKQIPAIIREVDDREAAVIALMENLQREDLNLFEEIEAIRRLRDEFGFTQTHIAQMLGLSQSTVANKLRLLQLSTEVRELISREKLSERHARALLPLESTALQVEVVKQVIEHGLNVKETEALVQSKIEAMRSSLPEKTQAKRAAKDARDAGQLIKRIQRLIDRFAGQGTEVEVQQSEAEGYIEVRLRIQTGKEY